MVVKFLSELFLRRNRYEMHRNFLLEKRLRVYILINDKSFVVEVPKGFSTDLASVPHPFEAIISNDDPDLCCAAVLHDFGYHTRGELCAQSFYTRRQIDSLLRVGMASTTYGFLHEYSKVNSIIKVLFYRVKYFIRRWVVWTMVRCWGWTAWRKYRKLGFNRQITYIKADANSIHQEVV